MEARAAIWLIVAGQLLVAAAPAHAVVVSRSNFPLGGSDVQAGDGDQANPTAPADAGNPAPFPATRDWEAFAGSAGLVTTDPDTNDTGFGVGSQENNPSTWDSTSVAGTLPARANFRAIASRFENGRFLYLAFSRAEAGGGVFAAFELNQDQRTWTNSTGDPIHCRTTGDVLLSYQILVDDTVDVLVQRWITTAAVSAAEAAGGLTNGEGCAKTGTFSTIDPTSARAQAAINASGTITDYIEIDPVVVGTTIAAEAFGEAGLDLTAVLNGAGVPCYSFGQVSLHGRSSDTDAASIHDLVGPAPLTVRNCTISGRAWHDLDADGAADAGEPGLAGFKLYLDLNDDNALGAGEPAAVAGGDGTYMFTTAAHGAYTVRAAADPEQPSELQGLTCSAPTGAECEHQATLDSANPIVTGKDFGRYRDSAVPTAEPANDSGPASPAPQTGVVPLTTVVDTKPLLSALRVAPVAFRARTVVSFVLDRAAIVRFTVERALRGRRVGGRCVRPTRSNRRRARCTRYVRLRGSFSRAGRAGTNSFPFTGRLSSGRLRPGAYRLVAVPATGVFRGAPSRAPFRVKR